MVSPEFPQVSSPDSQSSGSQSSSERGKTHVFRMPVDNEDYSVVLNELAHAAEQNGVILNSDGTVLEPLKIVNAVRSVIEKINQAYDPSKLTSVMLDAELADIGITSNGGLRLALVRGILNSLQTRKGWATDLSKPSLIKWTGHENAAVQKIERASPERIQAEVRNIQSLLYMDFIRKYPPGAKDQRVLVQKAIDDVWGEIEKKLNTPNR